MLYIPQYFELHELLPPSAYNALGDTGWELLDPLLLESLDAVRKMFGKMKVNDYEFGGKRQWSGLRTVESPYYRPYSQHSFGRAADLIPLEADVRDVRQFIVDNTYKFPLITGIELNVSWLHIDVRNTKGVKLFTP